MKNFNLDNVSLKEFASDILHKLQGRETPVFLCIGSDKFVCDSLGPIVGQMLIKKYNIEAYVYGNLDRNITANNLSSAVAYIETEHPYAPIILIDATLGNDNESVLVGDGGYPAGGRVLPIKKVGDISVFGVVESREKRFNLNTTKLKKVCDIANFIAKGLAMAMMVYNYRKNIRKMNLELINN